MIGPGKYDDLCTEVRLKAVADGAILIIIDGDKGCGFSVQAHLQDVLTLPALLRNMADTLEIDYRKGKL